MRLIDADALVDRLSEEANRLAEKAIHSKGQAVDYYTGMKTGMARAAIWANGTTAGVPTGVPTVDAEWMFKHGMIPDADFSAIDAVPVVRCKDCKYYEAWEKDGDRYCTHFSADPYEYLPMEDDDFCSQGERSE